MTPVMERLADQIRALHRAGMPKFNQGYLDYHTYVDLWDFGIYTMIFAAQDGLLYLPKTPEEGTPLTLVIIR